MTEENVRLNLGAGLIPKREMTSPPTKSKFFLFLTILITCHNYLFSLVIHGATRQSWNIHLAM